MNVVLIGGHFRLDFVMNPGKQLVIFGDYESYLILNERQTLREPRNGSNARPSSKQTETSETR